MDAASLLPQNRTPLESALARSIFDASLFSAADLPGTIKRISGAPAAFTPWLAAEWGLSEFSGYFDDAQQLIDAGLPWLRERGTAAAVKRALSWIGMAASIEEDGTRLQLDTGHASAPDNLASVLHLIGASVPAHVQLYRLYHGHDLRHFVLDRSLIDDGMLDADSGVWRDGVLLSFGRLRSYGILTNPMVGTSARVRLFGFGAMYEDKARFDAWAFDGEIVQNHSMARGRLTTLGNVDGLYSIGNMTVRQRIARASMVPDDGDRLDGLQARFDMPGLFVDRHAFRADDARLDDFDPGRHWQDRFEAIERQRGFAASHTLPTQAVALRGSTRSFSASRRQDDNGWSGLWDGRTWLSPSDIAGFSRTTYTTAVGGDADLVVLDADPALDAALIGD